MRAFASYDGEATTRVRSLPRPLDFVLVVPLSFNDARRVAEGLRSGSAVLIDLKEADGALAERLVDFAEGVAAALDCVGTDEAVDTSLALVAKDRLVTIAAQGRAQD